MRTEPTFSAESEDHLHASQGDSNASVNSESQLLSDYRQRYGLSTDPFVDDPHFPFYQGAQRRQILEQLLHLCQFSHNLLVVTGDYGVGKTRMAQALIDSLEDADDIAFVEGQITSDMSFLFSEILAQFELENKAGFAALCQKKSDQDGLVVLIVDNAHHLTDEVVADLINLLEENLDSRLHLVMFAEPHFLERMNKIDAPDIILTDFSMEKFSLADAVDYLNFRMEMADYLGPEIFIETKVEPWWRQSQGQLLALHDYAHEKLLESVSESRTTKSYKSTTLVPHIVAISVLLGGSFLGYLYVGNDSNEISAPQVSDSVPIAMQPVSSSASTQSDAPIISTTPSEIVAAPGVEKISEQTYSVTNVSVSASSAAPEKSPVQEVKQSVVPLAQTSSEYQVTQQPTKASANVAEKDVKSTTATSSKATITAKNKADKNGDPLTAVPGIYTAQEKTILSWDGSEFTLQIVGLSSEKSALEFIASQSNKKDLLLFKSIRQGKDWYVVVTGHYPNAAAARQAAKSLPESQLKATPWPRDLKTIHREIMQRE
jgi:DamX protein